MEEIKNVLHALLEGQQKLSGELQGFQKEMRDFREETNDRFKRVEQRLERVEEETKNIKDIQVTQSEMLQRLVQSQERQDRILDALATRSLEQETEIKELKRAK